MKVDVDLTLGRRFERQEKRLAKLTPDQSLEIVNRYLDFWAGKHGNKLPLMEESRCVVPLQNGDKMSIYPFSIRAIEFFHKATRSVAGDIVCLCGQCVNNMRRLKRVEVVEGAKLHFALSEARKKWPQIVANSRVIEEDRPIYMKDEMELRLAVIMNEMAETKGDLIRIIGAVENYSRKLGGEPVPEIQSARLCTDINRRINLSDNSRIWKYKEKKILVKYLAGPSRPIDTGRDVLYEKEIETQDVREVISFLEDGLVTHVLFITRWVKPHSWYQKLHEEPWRAYEPVIGDFTVDSQCTIDGQARDMVDIIVGVIEDGNSERSLDYREDLLKHVNNNYAGLQKVLDILVENVKTEKSLDQYRSEHKEDMKSY
jgi:hypothetical protein